MAARELIGVVPAAGTAVRLQPLAGSKEVVCVGGRPVMEYLVERMRVAGARIVVVTRPDKHDVAEHAEALGLQVVAGTPRTVSESLLLGLEGAGANAVALLGFPDTIWGPVDGYVRLLARLEGGVDAVLGVFHSPEPERSDVVTLDDDRVVSVELKPARPSGSLVWGCAVATVGALRALGRYDEPGDLFAEQARRGSVRAVRFPGAMIDVGTPEALARARAQLG